MGKRFCENVKQTRSSQNEVIRENHKSFITKYLIKAIMK